MTKCDSCGRNIGETFTSCPMCGTPTGISPGVSASKYPVYKRRRTSWDTMRNRMTLGLVMLTAATVIVNICVGGRAWSLYAVIGAYIHYQTFLSFLQVEASIIKKFLSVTVSTCLLLAMIQVISYPGMSAIQSVIPIILYAALIVSGVVYFSDFRSQKSHIIPILFIISLSLGLMVASFTIFRVIKWPTIVLASISLAIILVSLIFFRKPIYSEIKKKIHY